MKEKLIELLKLVPPVNNNSEVGENFRNCALEKIADHFIEEGVTIPVRCKDCKHREKMWGEWCCGVYDDCTVDDNSFCSYGEKKVTLGD